jgi:hypothetical protein
MAATVVIREESTDYHATWSHVFQNANGTFLFFDTTQRLANFFVGLQGQSQNAWDTQIPKGAEILSATMEFTGFQSNSGLFGSTFTMQMSSPNRALQLHRQDPIQQPFEVFEGWRTDKWTNAVVAVISTTFTTIASPAAGASNQSVALRHFIPLFGTVPNNALVAQRITANPGNTTIASISWEMTRSPIAPPGNMRLRLQGVTIDRGVTIPDGVDIAVTNDVVMSSVATSTAGANVTFTFPAAVSLVAGQQYFLILEPDPYFAASFPAGTTSWIATKNHNAFLTNGQLYHFGEGLGFDWQNYPGVADLNDATALAGDDIIPGGTITWPIGNVTANALETSPDISTLIQAQVDMPNYTPDSGMIISLSRAGGTSHTRVMSSNYHATNPGPVLRVSYRRRRLIIS